MFTLLILGSLSFAGAVPALPAPPVFAAPDDPALDGKIKEAGGDVTKLLELAATCTTAGQEDSAKKVYEAVLKADAANEAAHKALHHQFYDGKWFESFAELTKYKRDEDGKMKAKGLARFKDEWVPATDVPYLAMGWEKDDSGAWVSPAESAHAAQVAKWEDEGYEFRADDNSWIAPDDADHWAALEWKCGNEWLDTAKANAFHSEIGTWWQLSGEHFITWTTCDWDGGNIARWHADKIWPDMARLFGLEPERAPHFIVLNSLGQYNQAAGGNPPPIPESEGVSSLYGAYFADQFLDASVTPKQFAGAGVCFWDRKDDKLKVWGPYFLRWAAAQSYVDAIDPSWVSVSELVSGNGDGAAAGGFWAEKKIPRWLRYGAASYAERFLKNPEAVEGGNPWDIRQYACGEVKNAGGLRKLDDIFAFQIDVQKADDATRLYHEAGLLVAYLLDGSDGNKQLRDSHEAFKEALQSGNKAEVAAAADTMQKVLVKSEKDIRKFAGL